MRVRNLVGHADKNEVKKHFLPFINSYGECKRMLDYIGYVLTEYSDRGLDAHLLINVLNSNGDYITIFTSETWLQTMYNEPLEDYNKLKFEVEIRSSDDSRRDEVLSCIRDLKNKLDKKFPLTQGCCTADVMTKAVTLLHIYIK